MEFGLNSQRPRSRGAALRSACGAWSGRGTNGRDQSTMPRLRSRVCSNLMIHTNFTPIGRKAASYPAASFPISRSTARRMAYGSLTVRAGPSICRCEPLLQERGGSINGFKIRNCSCASCQRPHFLLRREFRVQHHYHYWEPKRFTSEVRPIVGLHLHKVDFIFNPIVDTDYTGGFGNLEFVPATRVAYNWNDRWRLQPKSIPI